MLQQCKDCQYAKQLNVADHGQIGQTVIQCLRYTPSAQPMSQGNQIGVICVRPTVQPSDCCGEFKAIAIINEH